MVTPAGRLRADFIILTLSPSCLEFSQSLFCCSTSAMFTKVPSTLSTRTGRTVNSKENIHFFRQKICVKCHSTVQCNFWYFSPLLETKSYFFAPCMFLSVMRKCISRGVRKFFKTLHQYFSRLNWKFDR